jgi:hypothetical protein
MKRSNGGRQLLLNRRKGQIVGLVRLMAKRGVEGGGGAGREARGEGIEATAPHDAWREWQSGPSEWRATEVTGGRETGPRVGHGGPAGPVVIGSA